MRAANSESLNNWHVNANDFITPTLHTAYMPKGFTFHGNSASVAIFTAAAPCSAQRSSHQRRRQTPAKEKQSKQYNLFSFVVSSDSVRVCVRTPPLISAQVTSLAKWLEFKSIKSCDDDVAGMFHFVQRTSFRIEDSVFCLLCVESYRRMMKYDDVIIIFLLLLSLLSSDLVFSYPQGSSPGFVLIFPKVTRRRRHHRNGDRSRGSGLIAVQWPPARCAVRAPYLKKAFRGAEIFETKKIRRPRLIS